MSLTIDFNEVPDAPHWLTMPWRFKPTKAFDESQHPRDEHGRFSVSGGESNQERHVAPYEFTAGQQVAIQSLYDQGWPEKFVGREAGVVGSGGYVGSDVQAAIEKAKKLGTEIDIDQSAVGVSDVTSKALITAVGDLEKVKSMGLRLPPAVRIIDERDSSMTAAWEFNKDEMQINARDEQALHGDQSQSERLQAFRDDDDMHWHPVSEIQNKEAQLVHELGHREHFMAMDKDAVATMWPKWSWNLRTDGPKGPRVIGADGKYENGVTTVKFHSVAAKVSGYAKANPCEFVAETFTAKVYGVKLPPSVEKMYKFFGGPDVPARNRG